MTITFETVITAGVTLGAAAGVLGLVGYDLLHSPTPHNRYMEAAITSGPAVAPDSTGATADSAPTTSGPTDKSIKGVEKQAAIAHDFADLTIFRVVTTRLAGQEYQITSGYTYQNTQSETPNRQFCYLVVPKAGSSYLHITLAEKAGSGGVVGRFLGEPEAESSGLPLDVLKESKNSCRWL